MERGLGTYKDSIYRILPEHLGYQKVYADFVTREFSDEQKLLKIQHCRDMPKSQKGQKTPLQYS